MFSRIYKHLTFANVAMTLALVFAMAGGAFAAGKVGHSAKKKPAVIITSTSQIKSSVIAALKGKTGPTGAAGKDGSAGPAGPAGSPGTNGTNGTNGQNGQNGATGPKGATGTTGNTGATGPKGSTGPEGVCSTASCVLPKGVMLKGEWRGEDSNGAAAGPIADAISLNIPLASAPTPHYFKEGETPGVGSGCSGTAAAPVATAGNLCVFAELELNLLGGASAPTIEDVTPFGFTVEGRIESNGLAGFFGTWAVAGN